MAIYTLAYTQHLEAAGVERSPAEAQIAGLARYILPDWRQRPDLAPLAARLERAIERNSHQLSSAYSA